jgi:hypothetical protein
MQGLIGIANRISITGEGLLHVRIAAAGSGGHFELLPTTLGDAQKLSLHLCALMHSFYQSETNAARLVYCCASPYSAILLLTPLIHQKASGGREVSLIIAKSRRRRECR